jgi:hypothetical protein
MWMGGWAPLGYDIKDRKLIINSAEATHVRFIFERFARLRSVTKLIPVLAAEGIKAKSGKLVEKGYLYRIISNPVYVGEAVHKGTSYPGEHKAIVERALWQRVQGILKENPRKRAAHSRARTPALLKGLIFGPSGFAMTPSHTRRNGKLYRYYIDMDVLKRGAKTGPVSRIAAGDVERAVIDQLRAICAPPKSSFGHGAQRSGRTTSSRRPRCARLSNASTRFGTSSSRLSRPGSSSCWSSRSTSRKTGSRSGFGSMASRVW